jgi:uncharacterized repeat protein (TIGR02543 family)
MLKAISLLLILLTIKAFTSGPELIFSDQFGGSADDFAHAIAVDSEGNTWITGHTLSSDLPDTDTALKGGVAVFIAKFSPTGERLLVIYFGGSGTDYAKAITVDSAGYIYITGGTSSSDLPLTSGGCNGPSDCFLAIFDPQGNLVHCECFGGSGVDYGRGIALDYNGNIYVAGVSSGTSTNIFIAKFDAVGNLIFFVCLEGKEFDLAYGVAVDYNSNIYVVGETFSSQDEFLINGVPVDHSVFDGVFDGSYNGSSDVFIAKFDSLGIPRRFTYLGGPYSETGFAINVSQEGVYVTGTAFPGFPITDGAYSDNKGWDDVFVSKLDLTLSRLEWSTALGGRKSDYGFAIRVDSKGYIWVIGHSYSDNFPTTANAFDREYDDEADVVIARLGPLGRLLVYATYSGEAALDSGRAIALNEIGENIHVHIAGYTESPRFLSPEPLTSFGMYNTDNDKGAEIFVAAILFPSIADLIISTTPGGTTDPVPGIHTYDIGTQAQIQAIPDNNCRFTNWSGDVSPEEEDDNPIIIPMYWDKSITANFIRQYTLTLSAGTGGTTEPWPGTYSHDSGTEITITARPNSGYSFSGWSGDVSSTNNSITITMNADKSVKANFSPMPVIDPKKCFIATAAYGSPLHSYVKTLRDFRDRYLISSKFGRALVNLYYQYSPPMAEFIAKHKTLKVVVQINLLPLVAFSYSMVHFGLPITAVILVLVLLLPVLFLLYQKKFKPS